MDHAFRAFLHFAFGQQASAESHRFLAELAEGAFPDHVTLQTPGLVAEGDEDGSASCRDIDAPGTTPAQRTVAPSDRSPTALQERDAFRVKAARRNWVG